ncbi:MAG: pyridoxal phosphate-dependent aminotransferase [Bdellovibrio sp.]
MKQSNYLTKIKFSKKYPYGPLAGSTPIFPSHLQSLLAVPLDFSESRKDSSFQELTKIFETIYSQKYFELVPGATQGFSQVQSILSETNKNVIIELPFYEPYLQILKNSGWNITTWKRSKDFDYDLNNLKKMKRVNSVLVLTNPNFFHGYVLTDNHLNQLTELFKWVVIDEVFASQFKDDNQFTFSTNQKNLILINSLSKSHGLSSLRFGWVAGPNKLINKIKQSSLLLHTDVPVYSQRVAVAALKNQDLILKHIKSKIHINRLALQQTLQKIPDVNFSDGNGHFVSIKLPKANAILKRWGLPSNQFGQNNFFRIRLDVEHEVFQKFLTEIVEYL